MKALKNVYYGLIGIALLLLAPGQINADIASVDTLPEEVEEFPANLVKPKAFTLFESAQPGTDVNVSNLAGNESEVSIDVNPTNSLNQVIVGHAPGFQTMNTFFTLDGGQTWTFVQLGNAEDGLISTFRFDPSVAFDDNGNVYAGYGVRTPAPAGGNQRTVVVCRSTDGGQTYPQCTQVSTTADIGTLPGNDKWHLATGPDPGNPAQQNVYIAWTQNITEPAGTDQRIVVSASTDGGATFSAPVIINDPSISGTRAGNLFADPAVGPNGELYVAWHDIGAGQVFVDVSLDAGATFGTDVLVTNSNAGFKTSIPPQPDRGVFVGPTLDVDRSGSSLFNGSLYLTYTDAPNGLPDTDIFVRFSTDGGATWSAPTLVNDDGGSNSQFLPWLDVDQLTGVVSVVWYDARNDTNNQQVEIFMAISDDGGVNFGPNILISDGQSDQSTNNPNRTGNNYLEYIGIASYDCRAFAVWADNSTNLADLDFFTDQVQITGLDTSLCNQPPIADANGPYSEECQGLTTDVTLDGSGSSDPENDPLTYYWFTTDCPGGSFDDDTSPTPVLTVDTSPGCAVSCNVSLTVTDNAGESNTATASVTISDTTPPVLSCNAPATITPPDAPISFTATAIDNCDSDPFVEITGYDCFFFTKKGKRIDKTESCVVDVVGDTITILDSGGVGTRITWTVLSVDECGNSSQPDCMVEVIKKGKP